MVRNRPTIVTVLAIFNFIFGAFDVITASCGGIGLFFRTPGQNLKRGRVEGRQVTRPDRTRMTQAAS